MFENVIKSLIVISLLGSEIILESLPNKVHKNMLAHFSLIDGAKSSWTPMIESVCLHNPLAHLVFACGGHKNVMCNFDFVPCPLHNWSEPSRAEANITLVACWGCLSQGDAGWWAFPTTKWFGHGTGAWPRAKIPYHCWVLGGWGINCKISEGHFWGDTTIYAHWYTSKLPKDNSQSNPRSAMTSSFPICVLEHALEACILANGTQPETHAPKQHNRNKQNIWQ